MAIKSISSGELIDRLVETTLPDRPSDDSLYGAGPMTPREIKKAFDALPRLLAERFNGLIESAAALGDDSLAALISTGIPELETLALLFGGITDGKLASAVTVTKGITLKDFYKAFLSGKTVVGSTMPTTETAAEKGSVYLLLSEGKIGDLYFQTSDTAPYIWVRYAPAGDYYIPSVTDGVLTFSPTDPDMPTLPDTPIDPLPKLDTADEGKVLTAEGGEWRAKALPEVTHPKELPTTEEADEGKVLTVKSGAAVWEAVAKEECLPELPSVTSDDNGKFLRVVNGVWQAEALATAEGVAF